MSNNLPPNNNNGQCTAYILMSISQILFPISYIYVSDHNFDIAQTILLRGFILTIFCYFIARHKQIQIQKSIRTNFKGFFIRNAIVIIHSYVITISHYYLSVSIIHSINSCGTLFVLIWDYILHGIVITKKQMIGIAIGISGIFVTANSLKLYLLIDPHFTSHSTFQNFKFKSLTQSLAASFILVIANIIWAYSASIIKTIKMKDSSQMNIHLGFSLIFVGGINYMLYDFESKPLQILLGAIFWSSIPIAFGQQLFVMSLTLTRKTGLVTLFISVSVIVGYAFSLLRYNERVNPIAVVGSILILTGLTIVVCQKNNDQSVDGKK